MMEKQTTFKSCKNGMATAVMMLCFTWAAVAQNLQTTLGESWTGTDWQNEYQSVNTYDVNDYLIGTLSQVWTVAPGQWTNATRNTYTNNPNGAATQILIEAWDGDTSEWIMSQRITNTLNGSNQVLTRTTEMWTGIDWFNLSLQTNTYGGGFLTSSLFQTWDFMTSNWINNSLTTYTNNGDGSVYQAVSQTWNPIGSAWDNLSRSTYTYNLSGKVLTELSEAWTGSAWQNNDLTTNTYVGGWLTVSLSQLWISSLSLWQNESQSLFTNNTDGTVAQIVLQQWSNVPTTQMLGGALWVNSSRITFTYEALGVDDFAKNRIVLYPNPANDFITVKSNAEYFNAYSITDQHGRIVQTGDLSGFDSSVDISGLSSGMYIFQMKDSRKAAVKLIKQ